MVWRCASCGAVHETNDPPCRSCGHDRLVSGPTETVESTGSFVWACPECDREHVKNNPPCSRCGNPTLERREPSYDDVDESLPAASYLSAVKPYAPVIVLFAVVIGLTATGTVTLGMLPGHGPPALPDAPGESEVEAGIDLETVEREIHERLEDDRADRGVAERPYDSRLAHLAAYLNRGEVRDAHGEEPIEDPDPGSFDLPCSRTTTVYSAVLTDEAGIDAYADESELATAATTRLRADPSLERVLFDDRDAEALDVHVGPDGDVYLFYATC